LIDKKVRIPPKKIAGIQVIPRRAAPADVEKYEDDQIGGPDKADIVIAWHQPLTSAWNVDAITFLAENAQQLLRASEIKYDKSWLELPELIKQITACLRDTKAIMNSSFGGPAKNATARRRARRQSVSCIIEQICHITHFGPES
jgi:hypothetical protein